MYYTKTKVTLDIFGPIEMHRWFHLLTDITEFSLPKLLNQGKWKIDLFSSTYIKFPCWKIVLLQTEFLLVTSASSWLINIYIFALYGWQIFTLYDTTQYFQVYGTTLSCCDPPDCTDLIKLEFPQQPIKVIKTNWLFSFLAIV